MNKGKRKLLKNIANGILGSFISRNNDVNGYWGIGKIYSLMIISESLEIEIDLIRKAISPSNDELNLLVSHYSDYLFDQLSKQEIQRSNLSQAKIIIVGNPNNPCLSLGRLAPHKMNCKITIIDNLNIAYTLEKNVWSREHNPRLEMKRGEIII
ncbi:hypothetical protein [Aquimarina mytili]|uniref:hypothetical protein n=1 Tax=Aquimarina mytili TaxID=874423 RepID=UPI00191D21AC|nr:hypothetical protein [Aquimarina mytili]